MRCLFLVFGVLQFPLTFFWFMFLLHVGAFVLVDPHDFEVLLSMLQCGSSAILFEEFMVVRASKAGFSR